MNKKGRNVFIIICVLAGVASLLFFINFFRNGDSLFDIVAEHNPLTFSYGTLPAKKASPRKIGEAVAVLYIDGVIEDDNKTYNQQWLCDTIAELGESSQNRGILLFISSPGGGVYQSDELYMALCAYKEKTERPVWAYLGSMAASGGYYIACAADTIYANRNTLTGSIGVICGQSVDMTGFFEKLGMKVRTIHSGRNKTMLNPDTPITEEQLEIMQSISDECYEQFVGIVSESRGLSVDDVKRLADGRIYTARQALAVKLVDAVAGYDEAKDAMKEDFPSLKDVPFDEYHYEYKPTFESFFSSMQNLFSGGTYAVPDFVTQKIGQYKFFPAYYAPGFN